MTPLARLWISHLARCEGNALIDPPRRSWEPYVAPTDDDAREADRLFAIRDAAKADAYALAGAGDDDARYELDGLAWAAWCAT